MVYKLSILMLAFVGGFAIMAIELLGGRILAPFFGSSVYVWGSIITVFMLSLSIGYLLGGRLSLHNPNLYTHAVFFLAAALTCLPLILYGNSILEWVFLRVEDPRYGSLLGSGLLFFVPTVILGMISPYSVRLLVSHTHHSGQIAGALYFVSTLGSALGTLATSFYLVLWFDVSQILWGIVATLLVAGGLAMLLQYLIETRQLPEPISTTA